jgi:predicted transcriptional regulator
MSEKGLSRRERQIMDILYQKGRASGQEVWQALPDQPGYSSVRALLRILEEKGHIIHEEEGPRYVYRPVQPRTQAARSALWHVVQTFFGGSVEKAVSTLVSDSEIPLSEEDLERLAALIGQAREKEA